VKTRFTTGKIMLLEWQIYKTSSISCTAKYQCKRCNRTGSTTDSSQVFCLVLLYSMFSPSRSDLEHSGSNNDIHKVTRTSFAIVHKQLVTIT